MSLTHEVIQQNLPLAAVSPLVLGVGVAATAATGAAAAKKMASQWHKTIYTGEVGVWLKGDPLLLDGFTEADVRAAEEADAEAAANIGLWKPGDDLPWSTESHYEIQYPKWRMIGPKKTLQRTYVTDSPDVIRFNIESADEVREKLAVEANITWQILPFGDNPVRALKYIRHVKLDKKDAEAREPGKNKEKDPLEERALQICSQGLSKVLSGKTAQYLIDITKLGENEEDAAMYKAEREKVQSMTIQECAGKMIRYGLMLTEVELMATVRTSEEVQAQAGREIAKACREIAKALGSSHMFNGNGKTEADSNGHTVPPLEVVSDARA